MVCSRPKLRVFLATAIVMSCVLLAPQARLDANGSTYPFCGNSFGSLGHFTASGTITFNTTNLTYGGIGGGVDAGGVAVYVFDSITVPAGTAIVGVGTRPLALISRGFVQIDGTITVSGTSSSNFNGSAFAGGAGGGAGGGPGANGSGPGGGQRGLSSPSGGGGGGFGGAGGRGGNSNPGAGGGAYGGLASVLQGGSGGGSGTGFGSIAGGGGGGGALLLSAGDNVTINTGAAILANGGSGAVSGNGASGGGSGGGIVLIAPSVTNAGAVRANGGHGGAGGCCGAGGGGGGGRILVAATTAGAGAYTATGGTQGIGGGGFGVGQAGVNGANGVITFDANLFAACIVDTTAPVVTPPADITVEATSSSGAEATYAATATDDTDGALNASCAPASGSTFPLGASTVTCSATDAAGNVGMATFTVTVVDTTPPAVSVPASASAEATSGAGAVVSFSASASDIVDGAVAVTCSPASGSTFALGTTTVACEAVDAAGNAASASFSVTVADTTAPDISGAPDNQVLEATGPGGAAATWAAPTATDAVSGTIAVSCSPASGSTFPLGTTGVTCTATDAAGNSSSTDFTVTVDDTTAPAISGVPANQSLEATGAGGAAATWTDPTAADIVDGAVAVNCSHASGSTFPLGTTTVNCSSSDAAGNSASASFTITVSDTTAPAISGVPANQSLEATGPAGAAATWTAPTAADIVDGAVAVNCSHASGSTFALGTTTVICSASDAAGNDSSASFTITVNDTTPPVISGVPGNQLLEATGPGGAAASWVAPTASDIVNGSVAVNCSHASGATFPLGTTSVTCSANDAAGNSSSASFTIAVQDTTAPLLTLPGSQVVEATGASGAVATWLGPTAVDIVSGVLSVSCSHASGATFPLGTTTVSCSVADAAGNSSGGSFNITVADTTAPVIGSVTPSSRSLWPPNHQLVPIAVAVQSSDAVSSPVCTITGVTSNEPDNGLGDGDTPNDIQGVSGLSVQLRAERAGRGAGRVYTIAVSCVDDAGNATQSSTTVTVPQSQRR